MPSQGLIPSWRCSPAEAPQPGASSVPTGSSHPRGDSDKSRSPQAAAEMARLGARPSPPPGVGGQKRLDTCGSTPAERTVGGTWRLYVRWALVALGRVQEPEAR